MLKVRDDLIKMRYTYARSLAAESKKILVCAGTGCISSGSLEIYKHLQTIMNERNIPSSVELQKEHHETVGIKKSGCHGFCEMGPLIRIEPQGWLYTKVQLSDCEDIIEKTIINGELIERLAYKKNGVTYPRQDEVPFYKKQTRLVLEHCGHIDADSISEYIAIGGYTAFEKALFDMSGDQVVKTIKDSNLRGRGGAGFPAGIKWETVRKLESDRKYILCNGDEGDPGAFMDRSRRSFWSKSFSSSTASSRTFATACWNATNSSGVSCGRPCLAAACTCSASALIRLAIASSSSAMLCSSSCSGQDQPVSHHTHLPVLFPKLSPVLSPTFSPVLVPALPPV
jgi:(2Fe-2S) ferredoxin